MKIPNPKSQILNKLRSLASKTKIRFINLNLGLRYYFGSRVSYLFCMLFWLSLLNFNASAQTVSDPLSVGVGARALSLGRSAVAVSDDCDIVFNNPAALGNVDEFRFTSMSGKLMDDVTYISMGGIFPLGGQSAISFGYAHAGINDIEIRNYRGTLSRWANFGNGVFIAGWGKTLYENIRFGMNLKYYMIDSTEIEEGNGSGWNLDLGFQQKGPDWLTLGVAIQNPIDCSPMIFQNGDREKLPTKFRLGSVMYIAGRHFDSAFYAPYELKTTLELDWGTQPSNPLNFHGGVEFSPVIPLSLRFGIEQVPAAGEIRYHACAGVGLQVAGIGFNYAYFQPDQLPGNASASHFFSMTFNERGWPPEPSPDIFIGNRDTGLIL